MNFRFNYLIKLKIIKSANLCISKNYKIQFLNITNISAFIVILWLVFYFFILKSNKNKYKINYHF